MTLLLTEGEVRSLLTMRIALEAVEESFLRLASGAAILHVRRRLEVPGKSFLHYMAAADTVSSYMGMKIYTSVRGALRFLVPLYRSDSGALVALLEADFLGQMRTGAASGIAAKYLAREDARIAGIIGTGLQARTQLEALCAVRKIERIRCFGRDAARRKEFAKGMSAELGVAVEAAASAEAAIRGVDIAIAATTASRPVILGEWLAPGMHINAIGANFPQKRELDDAAVRRADLIVADSAEQSKLEAGDLIETVGKEPNGWARVRDLCEVVSGRAPGRTSNSQLTLFKSNGLAIWDVAVAARVYELARERGIGRQVPLWEEPHRERT